MNSWATRGFGARIALALVLGSTGLAAQAQDLGGGPATAGVAGSPEAASASLTSSVPRGSVALGFSTDMGRVDTSGLSVAGTLAFGTGSWAQSLDVEAWNGRERGETGGKAAQSVRMRYEAEQSLGGGGFLFAGAGYANSDLTPYRQDGYVAGGAGLRLIDGPRLAWKVEAGPALRSFETATGETGTEAGLLVGSELSWQLGERMVVSNDTELLGSGAGFVATNDLGLTLSMTDALSTRMSYRSAYNSDPVEGEDRSDNRVGVSLVFGF